ncbi:MAG TPA: hypothetical protein VE959_30990 [Bryobacteraceae bacterium]|nr:hypothetical protein [Bryobacteraceae bacterium]
MMAAAAQRPVWAVRLVLIPAVLASVAPAQTVMDPARLSPSLKSFDPGPHDLPLRCEVTPFRPMLSFNFHFQAGYAVRIPMNQFEGAGHGWATLVRITPKDGNGQPVYLGERMRLPNVPPNKVEAEAGGVYLLGEGRYHVSWKLIDDSGRVCRKDWDVEAKLRHSEHAVKVALPPDTVTDLSLRGAPAADRVKDDAAPIRLTVLLHAAPMSPRRTRMGARDRILLLGTLSALLERVPVRSVRVVVFSLEQQKELYRQDRFVPRQLERVARSMDALQLDLVDYRVLQNRTGHLDLLADMVNRELKEPEPSDVVLFLGPLARYSDKVPAEELEKPPAATPRFFYFQYRPFLQAQAELSDSIHRAVTKLKGKVMVIQTPGDLAKGIGQIERK